MARKNEFSYLPASRGETYDWKPRAIRIEAREELKATTTSPSCQKGSKTRCPVFYVTIDGVSYLRFCNIRGKGRKVGRSRVPWKGRLVRVDGPLDALAKSQKFCDEWRSKGSRSGWIKPTSELAKQPLGGAKKRRKR